MIEKFLRNFCVYFLILVFFISCKEKPKLARPLGSTIQSEEVKDIANIANLESKEDPKNKKKELSEEEYKELLLSQPFSSINNTDPLTKQRFEELPESTQQAVAVLVNRGIFEWKLISSQETVLSLSEAEDKSKIGLYDYTGKAVSEEMIDEYIEKLKVVLEREMKDKKDEDGKIFTAENASIVVTFIAGLGTLMWGYREFKLHSKTIGDIDKIKGELEGIDLNSADNIKKLTPDLRTRIANAGFANELNDFDIKFANGDLDLGAKKEALDNLTKNFDSKKTAGSIFDMNSAKSGKFVYAPVLFATAMGTLGIGGYQVYEKFKDD